MNMRHHISLIAIIMFLQGCSGIGPQYKKPVIRMPERFTQAHDTEPQVDLITWWKFFNDPCLDQLIEKAVAQNYDLRTAIEKIEEMRCEYNIKTADLLPEIDSFGLILRNRASTDISLFANSLQNPSNILGLGLATAWELDVWGRLRKARSAAYADYQAQIESSRDVYIMLLADVAQLYISARSLEIKITTRERQLAIDTDILALTEDLFQSGLGNDIPCLIQEQQLDDSANYIVVLKKMLAQTNQSLAVLLGENPEGFSLPPRQAGEGNIPIGSQELKAGLPSELLRRRPDIRQAEQELIAANERIGESIGNFFPKFSLLGLVSGLSSCFCTWFDGNSLSWTIGPAFSWPLITFGRISYDVKAKESSRRQALYRYCQTVLNAFRDVENALVGYFSQQETVVLSERKLQSINRELSLIKSQFQAGLTNRIEYLLIEKSKLGVLLEAIDNQTELSKSLVMVYKSLGGGWDYD